MISLPQIRPETNGHRPAPNDIAMALTGRPHVSWSELRTFQNCPQKWSYQYVQHLKPERTSVALLLGIGIHAAIEAHFQAILTGDLPLNTDQLMAVFDSSWMEMSAEGVPIQYPKGHDACTIRGQARAMLEAFKASAYATPGGDIIGLEESFKVRLHPDLPDLAGRVDMLTYDRDRHELLITDYKTSRSSWSRSQAEAQATQLMLYAEGCLDIAEELEAGLSLQFIVITKTKQPKIEGVRVPLDMARIQATKQIITQVFRAMVAHNIYPVPGPINCTTCGFASRCPGYSGG